MRLAREDPAAATALLDRVLALRERSLPPDHPQIAFSLEQRGAARLAAGARDGARTDLERALAIFGRSAAADDERLIDPLLRLADLATTEGRAADAVALLERANAVCDAHVPALSLASDVRMELARALWESDRRRAHALAIRARDDLRPDDARGRERIDAWLATHGESVAVAR